MGNVFKPISSLVQDPQNPRRRLYKIFESFKHTSSFLSFSKRILYTQTISTVGWGERARVSGTSIGVRGTVAANKAARQSLADKITAHQASFDASAGSLFPDQPANKKAKAAAKPTKVGHGSSKFQILLLMRISMLHSPFLKRRRPRKRSARKLFNTLWNSSELTKS